MNQADLVGWVERSDTHQLHPRSEVMGIASLHPSYANHPRSRCCDTLSITCIDRAL
jgi:hypothetical protein